MYNYLAKGLIHKFSQLRNESCNKLHKQTWHSVLFKLDYINIKLTTTEKLKQNIKCITRTSIVNNTFNSSVIMNIFNYIVEVLFWLKL